MSAYTTRERPVLLAPDEVGAVLDGRLTQLRRPVVPQPTSDRSTPPMWTHRDVVGYFGAHVFGACFAALAPCPFGAVGGRLWVREGWARRDDVDPDTQRAKTLHYLRYRVDVEARGGLLEDAYHNYAPGWRSPVHMPRWASRITLELAGLRVERVQDVSEKDVLAEGITVDRAAALTGVPWSSMPDLYTAYREVWNHRNERKGYGWTRNVWTWVMTVRRVEP